MDRSSWRRGDPAATPAEQFNDSIDSVTTADADEYDTVLVGEPYDCGTVTRRGARDGPVAIRAALSDVATHHLDAGPVDAIGDLGSVDIPSGASVLTAREATRETVDAVHESDALPVILGGDSSLTVANVAGLLDAKAATDGGERTDGPRASSELRSDGGFGDDETVGDVEHFDPGGADEDEAGPEAEDDEDEAVEAAPSAEQEADDEPDEQSLDSAADAESEDSQEPETETEAEVTDADTDDDREETKTEAEAEAETGDDVDADTDEATESQDSPDSDEGADTDDTEETGAEEVVDDSGVGESGFGTGESATEVVAETTETTVTTETGAPKTTSTGPSGTTSTESVGVVRLGSRLDCQSVGSDPTNRNVGRQLLDTGVDSLAVVGARHFESTTAEAEYLRDQGGDVVTAEEVGTDPVEAADRALEAVADADTLYLSIDLSVLDATAAPGVSAPVPGGLQTRELFQVVRLLANDERLAGLEVVETAPTHDRDGQTVDAAARTVAHALAALQA